MKSSDTIFALSSGGLPSGIAVVRLSGPSTITVLQGMAGRIPTPRHATLMTFKTRGGDILDRGLCLYFSEKASFTGEESAELHLHGGRAVVAAILNELATFENLRMAEAGEFTKRAFLNGKLDLTAAEALADLIDAETEAQRQFALSNATENHKNLYDSWRRRLIQSMSYIEAELDFSDEDDVPGSVASQVWLDVAKLKISLDQHILSYHRAEIIRKGFQVVILGAPNAGKSSLLNALAQRDVAIVTDEPGTTRDVLDVSLDLGGMKVVLSDTAGIRKTSGKVESIGIARTLQKAQTSDLLILMEDVSNPVKIDDLPDRPLLKVGNKADLLLSNSVSSKYDLLISAKTGLGLEALIQRISDEASPYSNTSIEILPFRERHLMHLNEASKYLQAALDESELELKAEQMRLSSQALARITGVIDVEDLLEHIFSTFCIGK